LRQPSLQAQRGPKTHLAPLLLLLLGQHLLLLGCLRHLLARILPPLLLPLLLLLVVVCLYPCLS
jgi:hypothetical protein